MLLTVDAIKLVLVTECLDILGETSASGRVGSQSWELGTASAATDGDECTDVWIRGLEFREGWETTFHAVNRNLVIRPVIDELQGSIYVDSDEGV